MKRLMNAVQVIVVIAIPVFFLGLLLLDVEGKLRAIPTMTRVAITKGQHAGLEGNVVSVPWIGNGWHSRVNVNVPMSLEQAHKTYGAAYGDAGMRDMALEIEHGVGPRNWVWVSYRDVVPKPIDEIAESLARQDRIKHMLEVKYPAEK